MYGERELLNTPRIFLGIQVVALTAWPRMVMKVEIKALPRTLPSGVVTSALVLVQKVPDLQPLMARLGEILLPTE